MNIRAANENDALGILKVLKSLQDEGLDVIFKKESLPSVEDEVSWIRGHDGKESVLFVAEEEFQIVGMINANVLGPRELSLNCEFGVSVISSCRNKGIASSLIRRVEEWASSIGLRRVELEVFGNNEAAMRMYHKLGYVEDGRRVGAVRTYKGEIIDLVRMAKKFSK